MKSLVIIPHEDGLKHIRIGCKAMTKLGKLLSNSALCSFQVEGHEGQFRTMENWWVYVRGGCTNPEICDATASRIPKIFLRTPLVRFPTEEFRRLIMKGVRAKIEQNDILKDLLLLSGDLPFVRYNVENMYYGPEAEVIREQPWFLAELAQIRKDIAHERTAATA